MCHLVARELHKVAAPYFLIYLHIQLYKEDWGILRMLGCRAVALPSTEQIVNMLKMYLCLQVPFFIFFKFNFL